VLTGLGMKTNQTNLERAKHRRRMHVSLSGNWLSATRKRMHHTRAIPLDSMFGEGGDDLLSETWESPDNT